MIKAFTMANRWIYNSIWLMCLFTFNITYGAQVEMSVESTGYPDHLYKGEPITITCTASGYTNVTYVILVNGTANADTNHGCGKAGFWTPIGTLNTVQGIASLDQPYCTAAASNSPPFTITLADEVTESMAGLNLACLANLDGADKLSSDRLVVSDVRVVPPGNPQLSISGEESKIVEGKEFNFTCSSSGASPPSVYRYEILRNGEVIANTNTYKPVEADRDGLITLVCTDTVHEVLKDKYPERVVAEMEQKPYYLVVDGAETRTTSLNPAGDNTLYCEVSGYAGDAQIAYSWSCTGCTSTDRSLVIPAGSDDVETISCTASLASLPAVNITWTVTWSNDATLPTTTSQTTTTKKPPIPTWLIVVIVVVVVLALTALVVGIIWYKKFKTGKDTTDNGTSHKKNGDAEQMQLSATQTSNVPGKPKHQNSSKKPNAPKPKSQLQSNNHKGPSQPDELLYAELDHSQSKAERVQPKPVPPPAEPVVYASIDLSATKKYKKEGDAYGNLGRHRIDDSPTIPRAKPPQPPTGV